MGAPSLIDAQGDRVLSLLNAVADWHHNHVISGVASDGGTTQASGANTAPNVDIDVGQIIDAVVEGTPIEVASATDVDSDAGDQIDFNAVSGVSVIGALTLHDDGTYIIVFGTVAATADVVSPTAAEVQAFFDANSVTTDSVRVADVNLERTGDTAITVTIDHTSRPTVTEFPGDLAASESEFANGGVTRVYPIVTDPPPSV